MLPDESLARQVYAFAKARFDNFDLIHPTLDRPASWCNDVYTALQELKLTHFWTQGLPPTLLLSACAFKREAKRHVRLLDIDEWHASLQRPSTLVPGDGTFVHFSARAHYHAMKAAYGAESYLNQGDRKSALFKFYLRSGNFGLDARIHHGPPTPATSPSKSCKLCSGHLIEDEEHSLLHCPPFSKSRRIMWLNIESNLFQLDLFNEWRLLHLSPPPDQLSYLLGRTESYWDPNTPSVIDSAVRHFLLHAAHDRKELLLARP
jgi:hypothetical protein